MSKQAENPYLEGKRAWLEQAGDAVKAKNDYRLLAIGCFALAMVSLCGLVAMALQHKVVPYAVEFNAHSEVVRVTRADEMTKPNESQIKAALNDWIIGARSVWGDRRAQELMINKTYALTLPDSAAFQSLSIFHKENNPFNRSKNEAVEVAVHSVTPIAGDTWRIEWTETRKQVSGRVLDSKVWQGSFTVVIVPPVDEKHLLINPLGVHVKDFTWVTRL